jgi:tRNA G18 (ribose-2'-O)-methylase SpoU
VLDRYADVGNPAALERAGLFVAEGRHVVARLIEDGRFEIESILVTPAARAALDGLIDRVSCPVLVENQAAVNRITGFNFHRGCLALARRPAALPRVESFVGERRLLALEQVGNPDNIGGLFRVALALGAGGVLLDSASADPLYRKAIRTSMAAVLRVPFTRVREWPLGLDVLRRSGRLLVALTPAVDAVPIEQVPRDRKLVLLLGAEGEGLREETLHVADLRTRIPINSAADSLNVVVAAGIALHTLGVGS